MRSTTISTAAAVRPQDVIDRRDHRRLRRSRHQAQGKLIERSIEITGPRELLVRHPKNSVRFIVGQRGTRRSFKNKFRRKHDARDAELLPPTIKHRRHLVSGLELIRLRKSFSD